MTRSLLSCCFLLISFGCASDAHIESQALDFDDRDLSSIEHRVALLTVYIEPASANVRLRGIDVRNQTLGETFKFAFFDNFILRSSALPHIVADNTVQHMLVLDLPPGRYQIEYVEFGYLIEEGAQTRLLTKALEPKIEFSIGDRAAYLGRLGLRLGRIGARNTLFDYEKSANDRNAIEVGVFDEVSADVVVTVSSHADEDVLKAQQRFKALATQQFDIVAMSAVGD